MVFRGPKGELPFFSSRNPLGYTIPASETPEGKEQLSSYYEALGRFIDEFAAVEAALTFTLRMYAKTSPDIAKIIFSNSSVDIEMNLITQLAAIPAVGATEIGRRDLSEVFKQLRVIKEVRNYILHYGATSIAEGKAVVSNAIKAKGEPKTFPISPKSLEEMTLDLRKVTFHLNYKHLGRPVPRSDRMRNALEAQLSSAWKYNHPVQEK